MDNLYALLQIHNIDLTIAVYPRPDHIYYNDLESIQVKFWEKWVEKGDERSVHIVLQESKSWVCRNMLTDNLRKADMAVEAVLKRVLNIRDN